MHDSGYAGEGLGLFFWLIAFGLWFYFGYAQYRIATQIGHNSPWWSFIPILNFVQLIQLADKPLWWFFVCLIPFVNIVAVAWLWMETAKNCGKNPVWGFLMIVPFINFIAVGVLGFTSGDGRSTPDNLSQNPPYQREKVS